MIKCEQITLSMRTSLSSLSFFDKNMFLRRLNSGDLFLTNFVMRISFSIIWNSLWRTKTRYNHVVHSRYKTKLLMAFMCFKHFLLVWLDYVYSNSLLLDHIFVFHVSYFFYFFCKIYLYLPLRLVYFLNYAQEIANRTKIEKSMQKGGRKQIG